MALKRPGESLDQQLKKKKPTYAPHVKKIADRRCIESLFSQEVVPSLELDGVHLLLDQVFMVALSDFRDKFNMLAPWLPPQLRNYAQFIRFSHLCSKHSQERTQGRDPECVLSLLNAQYRQQQLPVFSDILQVRHMISRIFLCRPRLMRLAYLALLNWRRAFGLASHLRWSETLPPKIPGLSWPWDGQSSSWLLDCIEEYSLKLHAHLRVRKLPSLADLQGKLKKCFEEELVKEEWLVDAVDQMALNVVNTSFWISESISRTCLYDSLRSLDRPLQERIEGLTCFAPTSGQGEEYAKSLWNQCLCWSYYLLKPVVRACVSYRDRPSICDFSKVAHCFPWPLNTLCGLNQACDYLCSRLPERARLRPEVVLEQVENCGFIEILRTHAQIPPGLGDILENRHILAKHVLCRYRLFQLARLSMSLWKTDVFGLPYDTTWADICATNTGSELARFLLDKVFPGIPFRTVIKEMDRFRLVKPAPHVTVQYISSRRDEVLRSGLIKLEWLTNKTEHIAYLIVQGKIPVGSFKEFVSKQLPSNFAGSLEPATKMDSVFYIFHWLMGLVAIHVFFDYIVSVLGTRFSELAPLLPPVLREESEFFRLTTYLATTPLIVGLEKAKEQYRGSIGNLGRVMSKLKEYYNFVSEDVELLIRNVEHIAKLTSLWRPFLHMLAAQVMKCTRKEKEIKGPWKNVGVDAYILPPGFNCKDFCYEFANSEQLGALLDQLETLAQDSEIGLMKNATSTDRLGVPVRYDSGVAPPAVRGTGLNYARQYGVLKSEWLEDDLDKAAFLVVQGQIYVPELY